jgi:putative transposase
MGAEPVGPARPAELDLTLTDQAKFVICNHTIEQDHRGVKRVTRPMLGFKAFAAAQDTLVGIELMHMIKKRQMVVQEGDEGLTAAEQFYSLAA